jgi:hypothetical protein
LKRSKPGPELSDIISKIAGQRRNHHPKLLSSPTLPILKRSTEEWTAVARETHFKTVVYPVSKPDIIAFFLHLHEKVKSSHPSSILPKHQDS